MVLLFASNANHLYSAIPLQTAFSFGRRKLNDLFNQDLWL